MHDGVSYICVYLLNIQSQERYLFTYRILKGTVAKTALLNQSQKEGVNLV